MGCVLLPLASGLQRINLSTKAVDERDERTRPVTYYEELGVSPDAPVEEIREAYKQLARLLHPDTLREPRARAVAECQMKRLNSVYETLTHAERRHAYDLAIGVTASDPSLLTGQAGDEFRRWSWAWWMIKLRGPDGAWVGAGLIAVLAISWALVDAPAKPSGDATPPPFPRAMQPATPPTRVSSRNNESLEGQNQQLRRQVEQLRSEHGAAVEQIATLERRLAEVETKKRDLEMPMIAPTPAPITVPGAEPTSAKWSQPGKTDLAGRWYYAVSHPPSSGRVLYPPEYIEAVINEESGYLVGRYRARYRVSDRRINPEVEFQFSGKGNSSAARLPWLGSGGARGEVRLRLITDNTMEIAWIASELGHTQGLGSGTAVLVRRHDP